MQTTHPTLQARKFTQPSPEAYTWVSPAKESLYEIQFIENRWIYVKTHEIVNDLTDMLVVIRESERFWRIDWGVYNSTGNLIGKLQGGYGESMLTEVVHIINKYLLWVRKFLSNAPRQQLAFYKNLFESALTAIVREVQNLEARAAY